MKLAKLTALLLALVLCLGLFTACEGEKGKGESRPDGSLPTMEPPAGSVNQEKEPVGTGSPETPVESGIAPAQDSREEQPAPSQPAQDPTKDPADSGENLVEPLPQDSSEDLN